MITFLFRYYVKISGMWPRCFDNIVDLVVDYLA